MLKTQAVGDEYGPTQGEINHVVDILDSCVGAHLKVVPAVAQLTVFVHLNVRSGVRDQPRQAPSWNRNTGRAVPIFCPATAKAGSGIEAELGPRSALALMGPYLLSRRPIEKTSMVTTSSWMSTRIRYDPTR